MIWLLSTWCGSCAAGLQAMSENAPDLEKTGLRVLVLRNYRNDGYPGLQIDAFVQKVLPGVVLPNNWILGQASAQMDDAYNHRHYPDIYFLIDRQGRVVDVNGAPSATMARIIAFAKSQEVASQ